MRKAALSLPASLPVVLCLLGSAPAVRADSLSCSSINGYTLCTTSGGISCQATNGNIVCRGADQLRCEVAGGRMACRHGPGTVCETSGKRTMCRDRATEQRAPREGDESEDGDATQDDASPPGR
jgi:hypothetical protein